MIKEKASGEKNLNDDVHYTNADNRILQIDESFQPYPGYYTDFLR